MVRGLGNGYGDSLTSQINFPKKNENSGDFKPIAVCTVGVWCILLIKKKKKIIVLYFPFKILGLFNYLYF